MKPAEQWASQFGNDYTERNRVNWLERVPFWTEVIARTGIHSCVEIGCNVGWNLLAMRTIKPWMRCVGVDINPDAIEQSTNLGLVVRPGAADSDLVAGPCDLAFTAGVLIHIPPDNLNKVMRRVISESRRYVLAVEYEAEVEQEIEYRGQPGLLWKRPYGELYEALGLRYVWVAENVPGFDRCTAWLMEKI